MASRIRDDVARALTEDIGTGDVTAELVPEANFAHARVVTREPAILSGAAWFEECFRQLDPEIAIEWHAADGNFVAKDQVLCDIKGRARGLLTGERCSLNFLQTLSAVATRTRAFVDAVAGTRAAILDTRKTIPGLRDALKYAVRCGGGTNHRMGLYDGVLIKENHIAWAGGIAQSLAMAKQSAPGVPIEIEVENIDQLRDALRAGARLVLLDNFDLDALKEAVRVNAGQAALEASGGISLSTVRAIAETGVDYISIGSLTKDIKAVDLSMRFAA